MIQVTRGISSRLGRGCAVLAIACDETTGFWCALFEGGDVRFEHNRLTGARSIADQPATSAEVEVLCGSLGAGVSPRAVYEILIRGDYESAVARHAALAEALGLPSRRSARSPSCTKTSFLQIPWRRFKASAGGPFNFWKRILDSARSWAQTSTNTRRSSTMSGSSVPAFFGRAIKMHTSSAIAAGG
jgi:hypothetical protein